MSSKYDFISKHIPFAKVAIKILDLSVYISYNIYSVSLEPTTMCLSLTVKDM